MSPVGYEALCLKCGETFNPNGPDDTTHTEQDDGTPCGGCGMILGSWSPTT